MEIEIEKRALHVPSLFPDTIEDSVSKSVGGRRKTCSAYSGSLTDDLDSEAQSRLGTNLSSEAVDLSVVIPAYNEEECLTDVLRELKDVLQCLDLDHEIIVIDDGSTDDTLGVLKRLCVEISCLRVFSITPNSGQSAALGVGFGHARGRIVITMDADGQINPANIPKLIKKLDNCDVCCGYRIDRNDSPSRKAAGVIANLIRNRVLGENIIDTGCSLKAFKASLIRDLTMWQGIHRFLPSMLLMKDAKIEQIPVDHRSRTKGRSKYTNWNRLRTTIWDLWAVRWMQKRNLRFDVEEV